MTCRFDDDGDGNCALHPAGCPDTAQPIKALTVHQPWAWAIVHGGKDVENRTQAWGYRGPLAIHAGARISQRGLDSELVDDAWRTAYGWGPARDGLFTVGAFVGFVDLVGTHVAADGCCESRWGEREYGAGHPDFDRPRRRDIVHLELENPRSLSWMTTPIEAKGRLGLWTPPADVLDQLQAVVR